MTIETRYAGPSDREAASPAQDTSEVWLCTVFDIDSGNYVHFFAKGHEVTTREVSPPIAGRQPPCLGIPQSPAWSRS